MKIGYQPIVIDKSDDFEETMFGIEDEAIVIDILRSKLYSNPIKVLIQEYMSNARDAHREVNKDEVPIEVVFPTLISPQFEVRDFGPGLTPERIAKVFVKYGSSTKRNSNRETGGFGIGAKSAWSYTDTFQVISITPEDGCNIKRSYCCIIDETRKGKLVKFGETEKTDEAVGTRVIVPVKKENITTFNSFIKQACVFWDVKPNCINDTPVSSVEIFQSGDKWAYFNSSTLPLEFRYNRAFVIYDGIPYPLKIDAIKEHFDAQTIQILSASCFGLMFDVGEIIISANREELQYTESTKKTLIERISSMITECANKFEQSISKETTFIGAIRALQKVIHENSVIGSLINGAIKWNGIPIRSLVSIDSEPMEGKKLFYTRVEKFYFDEKTALLKRCRDASININTVNVDNVYINDLNTRTAPEKTFQYMFYGMKPDDRKSFEKYVISFYTNNTRQLTDDIIPRLNQRIDKWKKENYIDVLFNKKISGIPKPGKNCVIPVEVLKASSQKLIKYKILSIPDGNYAYPRIDETEDLEENIEGYYAMYNNGNITIGGKHVNTKDSYDFKRYKDHLHMVMKHLGIKQILLFTPKYSDYISKNDQLVPIQHNVVHEIISSLDETKIKNYYKMIKGDKRRTNLVELFINNSEFIHKLNPGNFKNKIERVLEYEKYIKSEEYAELNIYFSHYASEICEKHGLPDFSRSEYSNDDKYPLFMFVNTYNISSSDHRLHIMEHFTNYINSIDTNKV